MDRSKIFERALLGKQIGGNGLIVIADTIYLLSSVFFGMMGFIPLIRYVLFESMLVTCILYHNFIVSRGDMRFELNTEKIVFYPTTREQYLLSKYAKTLIFLAIQLSLTGICLIFGYYGNRCRMEGSWILGSLLAVCIGILLTSGTAVLVMHIMPLGIYLSMLIYIPLAYGTGLFQRILERQVLAAVPLAAAVLMLLLLTFVVWFFMLWAGVKIYERIT